MLFVSLIKAIASYICVGVHLICLLYLRKYIPVNILHAKFIYIITVYDLIHFQISTEQWVT